MRNIRIIALAVALLAAGFGDFSLAQAKESNPLSIEVQVAPNNVLLTPDKKLRVDILIRDRENAGVENLKPEMAASSGRLGDLKELGGGKYQATYHMPKHQHPQVVILAARVAGALPGWTVLYLRAKTELPVNTNKPNVMVTLTLGDKSYGPVRTDSRGRINLPVEVHPSQTEALAVAVDEFGNKTRRKVSIPIPRYSRLVGFAEKKMLAADGQSASNLYIIQVHSDGSPARDVAFVAYRSVGSVSKASRIRPGLYKIRYTAPAGMKKKKARLTIADKRNPKSSRQDFFFELAVGLPDQLTCEAQPDTLVADGKSTCLLKIEVSDAGGNPLDDHPPRITCGAGRVGQVSAEGQGRFRAIYTAPTRAIGAAFCTVEVDNATDTPLSKKIIFHLVPPMPAKLEVESDGFEMIADGQSTKTIQILVQDEKGNPLGGVDVRAHTTLGKLSRVMEDGHGHYHLVYTSPREQTDTKIRISLEAGQESHPLEAFVVIDLKPPPEPKMPVPWISLGAWAGVMTNFGRMPFTSVSLETTVRLPFGGDRLHLGLQSGFRFGSESEETNLQGVSVATELEFVPLHLSFLVSWFPGERFNIISGIGGGVEFVQWSMSPSGGVRERGHETLLGAVASLDGEIRLGPGALFLTVRYLYAYLIARSDITQATSQTGTAIKGNVGGLDAGLGYRLFF